MLKLSGEWVRFACREVKFECCCVIGDRAFCKSVRLVTANAESEGPALMRFDGVHECPVRVNRDDGVRC